MFGAIFVFVCLTALPKVVFRNVNPKTKMTYSLKDITFLFTFTLYKNLTKFLAKFTTPTILVVLQKHDI
jgi:hypothetical protein